MRLKNGFVMQEIGSEIIVVPIGEASECFKGVARINETAAFLMEKLKNDTTEKELVEALRSEYKVDRETAENDARKVIRQLMEIGALENI